MKRFFQTLTALCLASAALICCTSATPVKGKTGKKATKTTAASKPAAALEDIKSFRYELYKGGVSEVYYYSNTSSTSSFYTRDMGSNTGWNYTVNTDPVKPLSQLAAELNLDQYPDDNLANEDTSRDRWIIIVEYTGGKEKSICTYTNETTAPNDKVVRDKAEAVFKAIKYQDKDGKMMGEYSKTVYVDGKRTKEIFYTRDGIVRGGDDYTSPKDAPSAEYGVPQAPGKLY